VRLTLFGSDLSIKRAKQPRDSAGMRLYHDSYFPPHPSYVSRAFVLDLFHCLPWKCVNAIFCYDWLLSYMNALLPSEVYRRSSIDAIHWNLM
jgi:hypothetical protein